MSRAYYVAGMQQKDIEQGSQHIMDGTAKRPRYIDVKSVARLKQGHRFFLSDNEYDISRSPGASGLLLFLPRVL
jgi:hypothetical protein